jgi:uncharacterized protein
MFDSAEIESWEHRFEELLRREAKVDPAHDLDHVKRVVANSRRIGELEGADAGILLPAAWLHDCVVVEKDSPDRQQASTLAADRARRHLSALGYPGDHFDDIAHAIEAHSFSAGIEPTTLEAKVLQDADRLDALGAIGVARCFMVGGALRRPVYDERDPFCRQRAADDERATIDHFFTKLLTLPRTMQTAAGRHEAERRARFLKQFLDQLESELPAPG